MIVFGFERFHAPRCNCTTCQGLFCHKLFVCPLLLNYRQPQSIKKLSQKSIWDEMGCISYKNVKIFRIPVESTFEIPGTCLTGHKSIIMKVLRLTKFYERALVFGRSLRESKNLIVAGVSKNGPRKYVHSILFRKQSERCLKSHHFGRKALKTQWEKYKCQSDVQN